MHQFWRRLLHARRGATAMEYGMILALIAVAMMVAMQMLNQRTGNLFGSVSNALTPS